MGKISKKVIFQKERNELMKQLKEILKVKDDRFDANLVNSQKDIQDKICNLSGDIKKYFSVSAWSYYRNRSGERGYLSLVKNVFKDMDFEIFLRTQSKNKLYYIEKIVA
jgi:hypothetical protein